MNEWNKNRIDEWVQSARIYNPNSLHTRTGTILARPYNHVVVLTIPSPGIRGMLARLQRALTKNHLAHVTMDWRVAEGLAQLSMGSIAVIDNVDDRVFPESLIRAEVTFPYGNPHGTTRKAYFLSGWDTKEFLPVYFFCELPPGASPQTIAEAREALKPEAVKLAESMGRKVRRQGDIFAIPLKDFTPRAELIEKNIHVAGTNHRVTEGYAFYSADGVLVTYARGKLMHRPSGRHPDHRTVKLGRDWFLLVKNTVPTVG